jgi:histidinol-phosphate/aromatic aminotransferase/cobyric acid decarboxylase-like protein
LTVLGGAAAAAPAPLAAGRSHSGDQRAPFVLIRVPAAQTSGTSCGRGFAVRRGDTFPGPGPDWLRIAVRDPATSGAVARSLPEALA